MARRLNLPRPMYPWLLERAAGDTEACWPWPYTRDRKGYGMSWDPEAEPVTSERYRRKKGRMRQAYRIVFEEVFGPVPKGLELDHTCHDTRECQLRDECPHRACVNPHHLEVVTHAENCKRTFYACLRGHDLTIEGALVSNGTKPNGKPSRACRICRKNSDSRKVRRRRVRMQAVQREG